MHRAPIEFLYTYTRGCRAGAFFNVNILWFNFLRVRLLFFPSFRLRLKFSCMMELSRYPLDSQICGMQIASCKYYVYS